MPGTDLELYCPACGFPFGHGFPWTDSDYDEHPYMWMYTGYAFETGDSTSHRVFQVGHYDYRSEMNIYGLRDKKTEYTNEMFDTSAESDFSSLGEKEGIVLHESCVKAIESFLGRPFTYKDAIVLYEKINRQIVHKNVSKYNKGEYFDWETAAGIIPYSESNNDSNNSSVHGELPEWIFKSPLQNKKALHRIISRLPEEIRGRSAPRSRMVHTMVEHINGLPKNIATMITPYVTGMKPHEYMPDKYKMPTLHPEVMKRRHTRKMRKARKARKARKSRKSTSR